MNNPLVTILSPCYNVGQFLPKYFETVLGQTYSNLQVVLIDDGSKDDTWAVMQEYAAKDSRVEVYHQENQGVAATRNNLLDKVKGDYVLFVDSDDWIELDMVEYLVRVALEYNSKFVMCDRVINDANPKECEPTIQILSQEQAVHDFLRHEYFVGSLWNKLLDSSLLHNERFHCGISYGEDALFCWGVLQKVDKVVVTDRQLYHYRMNERSISHSNWTPEGKGCGHCVWKSIAEDVAKAYPQYVDIVNARYAIEDMWGIYFASLCNYPYDEHICTRQQNIRRYFWEIKQTELISKNKVLFAWISCRWYGFGWILRILRRIKGQD